jgi:hypothetical protein
LGKERRRVGDGGKGRTEQEEKQRGGETESGEKKSRKIVK